MGDRFDFEAEPFEGYTLFDETPELEYPELNGVQQEAVRDRRIPMRPPAPRPRPTRPRRLPARPSRRPWPRPWPWSPVLIAQEPLSTTSAPEGAEYIRWVQSSLNQVLGLRLLVNGVMGPETRSAIRMFQQREGVPVDGIVGPPTEAALVAAAGGRPAPAGAAQTATEFDKTFGAFAPELSGDWTSEIDPSAPAQSQGLQGVLRQGRDWIAIQGGLLQGLRDADKLTNLVFFARHPERQGRKLTRGEPQFTQLSREWLDIRDRLVKPALTQQPAASPPTAAPQVGAPRATAPAPPAEGPLRGITGKICPSGSGKCWKPPRSADIIDADVPWNDASNRSAASYEAVLDYFNVGNSPRKVRGGRVENPRYAPIEHGSTWCNIYVHDVTRAMWASIPHWVHDARQRGGWNELNANQTVDWLLSEGRGQGWIPIDASFCEWVRLQFQRRTRLPYAGPTMPERLRVVAERIAGSPHANPDLLSQPSYIAQQCANQGLPTVVVWKNPARCGNRMCAGHVAMIRPERDSVRGEVQAGVFVPRSAQAGRHNWTNQLATNMVPTNRRRSLFFVHE